MCTMTVHFLANSSVFRAILETGKFLNRLRAVVQKTKIAFALNIVLFVCVVFSTCWMLVGGNVSDALSVSGVAMLRYFTVDSNILLGVVTLVAAIGQWGVLKGKKAEISTLTYALILMGTASVTLTMLVTVFFLTPTMAPIFGLFGLFTNSNFFMHLFNPVLAIVAFVGFEKTKKLQFKHVFAGIVPMLIYAVYYVAVSVVHSTGGFVDKGYDWYGFFVFGLMSGFIVVPLVVLITFGISFALWKLNKRGL